MCVLCFCLFTQHRAAVLTGYGVVLAPDWMTGSTGRTGSRGLWSSTGLFLDAHWLAVTAHSADLLHLLLSVWIHFPSPLSPPFSPLPPCLILHPTSSFNFLPLFPPSLFFLFLFSDLFFFCTATPSTWHFDFWPPASHWVQYELAEQAEPSGPRESVGPERCPLQPLHCWPGNLPHGVWEPLETGELETWATILIYS